jgi:hypothetical protein
MLPLYVDNLESLPVECWKFYGRDGERWRVDVDIDDEFRKLRNALKIERATNRNLRKLNREFDATACQWDA